MSEREAWDEGYRAGREDAMGSICAGASIGRENPYALKCGKCGCDLRYPDAIHVLDCGEEAHNDHAH
jgi:hypothetical protein